MCRFSVVVWALWVVVAAWGAVPAQRSQSLPEASTVMEGFEDFAGVESRLRASALHPVEGLWEFPADGGTVAIIKTQDPGRVYDIVLVQAANRALAPGTLMGRMEATAKEGMYRAEIYTAATDRGTSLCKPRSFTLTLDADRLTFKQVRRGWSVNLWRLLPYMFRLNITRHDDSPRDLDGLIRRFPRPAVPFEPVYL